MNEMKDQCRNYNHGKSNPAVSFCPNCGERFKNYTSEKKTCSDQKHQSDRKNRNLYCTDCGRNLNP